MIEIKVRQLGQFASCDGMVPSRKLSAKSSNVRSDNLLSCDGMVPLRAFSWRSRLVSWVNLLSCDGMVP